MHMFIYIGQQIVLISHYGLTMLIVKKKKKKKVSMKHEQPGDSISRDYC